MSESKGTPPAGRSRKPESAASGRDSEHGFRIPTRRRKPIYYAAVAILAVVSALIYLMAKPDPERLAAGYLNAMQAALPQQGLAIEDLQRAVLNLEKALDAAPGHAGAVEAMRTLQERALRQIDGDIRTGELETAEEMLGAAAAVWPDAAQFDMASPVREQLAKAKQTQQLYDQIRDLLAQIKQRASIESDQPNEGLRTMLAQLSLALQAWPVEEQASALRANVGRDVAATVRDSLKRDASEQARQLMDAVPKNWGGNEEIDQLRKELEDQLQALDRSRQVRELLARAESSIAADRLTNPPGNNAVGFLREALELDPGNARARQGLESVADRYAVLTGDALATGSLASAQRFAASLKEVAPGDIRLNDLEARIREDEAAQAAAQQATAAPEPPNEAPQPEPLPDDPEGQLWSSVRNSCRETELRHYINTYPSGRYADQAWQRISDCLAEADSPQ